jgi:hypothetical protein
MMITGVLLYLNKKGTSPTVAHQLVKSSRDYVAFVSAGCIIQHEVSPVAISGTARRNF